MDEGVGTEPVTGENLVEPRPAVGKRRTRVLWRDVLIPFVAIGAVIGASVLVQGLRARDSTAPASAFAPGSYSAIELGPAGEGSPNVGKPAPGFQLLDASGQVVRLEDFRGRPAVVNFWATWCVPCRKEIPDLVALQQEWGDTAQIVGVNYYESAEAVTRFAADFSINYPLPLDSDGRVTGSYRLTGLPETFFVDGTGVLRDHRIGLLRPEIARCIVAGIQAGSHEPKDCR